LVVGDESNYKSPSADGDLGVVIGDSVGSRDFQIALTYKLRSDINSRDLEIAKPRVVTAGSQTHFQLI